LNNETTEDSFDGEFSCSEFDFPNDEDMSDVQLEPFDPVRVLSNLPEHLLSGPFDLDYVIPYNPFDPRPMRIPLLQALARESLESYIYAKQHIHRFRTARDALEHFQRLRRE
jgi:hypothetical protein